MGASICEHGRMRSQCKECGGSSICEHGRQRYTARTVAGVHTASTVVSAEDARSAVGQNLRARSSALSVQGVRWGINLRARSSCALSARSAVGDQSASTVVSASCKECGGSQICEHGRRRHSARSVAPQRLERMHSSARTPNVVQHIFLQLPIYRTDPRAVVSPPPPDPSSAAAWP